MVTLMGGYAIDRHVRSNTTYLASWDFDNVCISSEGSSREEMSKERYSDSAFKSEWDIPVSISRYRSSFVPGGVGSSVGFRIFRVIFLWHENELLCCCDLSAILIVRRESEIRLNTNVQDAKIRLNTLSWRVPVFVFECWYSRMFKCFASYCELFQVR